MKFKLATAALAVAASALAMSAANAAITITVGPGGGNPAENILFNGATQTNQIVTGYANQTNTAINFKGNEILVAAGGQSQISASDGGFNYLEWSLAEENTGYNDLLFNILKPNNTNNSVTLTFFDQSGGSYSDTFQLGNGQNFFRVKATDGDLIKLGKLETTANITSFEQVRLGGVGAIAAAVPEPATWAMLIAGFGLIGASMRRRTRVSVTYA